MSATKPGLLQQIEGVVGAAGIVTGNALRGRSAGIWSGAELRALALVRPANTAEVAAVMQLCHAARQAVVPAGGRCQGSSRCSTGARGGRPS